MPTIRLVAAVVLVALTASPSLGQFWNPFRSKSKAEQKAAPVRSEDLQLTQESGPWLILATTFSGEGAKEQARQLCQELRQNHGLQAYLHEETFNLRGEEPVGRGIDQYGDPVPMKYRVGDRRTEWAVLVGDYPTIDDSLAQRDLQTVRTVRPGALDPDESGRTHQNFAGYRQAAPIVAGRTETNGPMRSAFLTRNPMLPEEYFVPKGVDKFVAKMNKGFEHSALDIKGKYTVKVATFAARGTLIGANSSRRASDKKNNDPLVIAAENAHLLCEEMRRKGWEAYEFHDRTESYVTVGSFDEVARGGQPTRDILEVVRTFGATFDTPPAPLQKQRTGTNAAGAQQVVQSVNGRLTNASGQVATGMHPKYAMIMAEDSRIPRTVTFDVHPHVVEAPRRSVSSVFAWNR